MVRKIRDGAAITDTIIENDFGSSYWEGGSGDLSGSNGINGYLFDQTTNSQSALIHGTNLGHIYFTSPVPDYSGTAITESGTLSGSISATHIWFTGIYDLTGSITAAEFEQASGTLTVNGSLTYTDPSWNSALLGEIDVSGSSALFSGPQLEIDGTFSDTNGGSVQAQFLSLGGSSSSGTQSLTVSGTGSTLSIVSSDTLTGNVDLWGNSANIITVSAGGTLNALVPGSTIILGEAWAVNQNLTSKPPAGSATLLVEGTGSSVSAKWLTLRPTQGGSRVSVSDHATLTVQNQITLGVLVANMTGYQSDSTISITSGGGVEIGGNNIGPGADTLLIDQYGHLFGNGLVGSTVSGTANGTSIPTYSLTVENNGTITARGSTLDIQGNLTGTGAVLIDISSTFELGGSASSTVLIEFDDTGYRHGTLLLDDPGLFSGTIAGFTSSDTIDIAGVNLTAASFSTVANANGTNNLVLTGPGGTTYTFQIGGYAASDLGYRPYLVSDGHGGTDVEITDTLDLAQLNLYTYGIGTIAGGYQLIENSNNLGFAGNSAGFTAKAFQDTATNQIVISIDTGHANLAFLPLENILADPSYATGTPSATLLADITDAVSFLQTVLAWAAANDPGAQIVLTGHSIGGAVAQLLGEASGFQTIVFDAPGAQAMYSALASALAPILNISGLAGQQNTDIRYAGDQISFTGTAVGTTITAGTSGGSTTPLDLSVDNELSTLINELTYIYDAPTGGSSEVFTAGTPPDTNYTSLINGVPSPSTTITNAGRTLLSVQETAPSVPGGVPVLTYKFAGGYHFIFNTAPGSPKIAGIELPANPGVFIYAYSFEADGVWSTTEYTDPDTLVVAPPDASAFQFTALNSLGTFLITPDYLPPDFLIQVAFGSARTVSATLTGETNGAFGPDLSGTGGGDILWRNGATGDDQLWTVSGATVSSVASFGNVPTA